MQDVNVNIYKTRLISLRNELTQHSDEISKDLHHETQDIEKDFAEQATQLENQEVLEFLGDEAKARLLSVNKALLRIEAGNFGICEQCGKRINGQRLEIIPYVSLCIQCAENED